MIKRPWQIWTVYGLCVLLVLPAMLWLSFTTWQLDQAREIDRQATEAARRQAELQERVSSALWRMDWLIIPLVAQEVARPYYMYNSFFAPLGEQGEKSQTGGPAPQPSPILTQPSEFILLHFQIGPDNTFESPQTPQGESRKTATVVCGVPDAAIEQCGQRLNELREVSDYETISQACPATKLPAADKIEFPWQANDIAAQVSKNMASPKEELLANSAEQVERQLLLDDAQSQAQAPAPQTAETIEQVQQKRSSFRASSEFLQRDRAAQSYAKGQFNLNRFAQAAELPATPTTVTEGVMRPFWLGDRLIMARRVDLGDRVVIQGCWLNWEKIQAVLLKEIADVIPEAQLQPVNESAGSSSSSRKMATLPIQLVDVEKSLAMIGPTGRLVPGASGISGLKISLAVAWVGLILGLIAIAALLQGVIRLSERRAAFASAVTHELRTPLTTFRMYAEMLAEGMIPSADKQQQYARTMKAEADRLGHLVENVLRYARLERRNVATRSVPIAVGDMLDRFRQRLIERAEQSGMELKIELDPSLQTMPISTDPGTVEQIVFNLVDNSCKYAASAIDKTIQLEIRAPKIASAKPSAGGDPTAAPSGSAGKARAGGILITVRDHGPGIDARMSKRLFTAFSKSDQEAAETARGVGLGLALCRRMAADLGGRLVWNKEYSGGASFTLTIPVATP